MKLYISFILLISLTWHSGNGQTLYNGDFNLPNNGNDLSFGSSGQCATFSNSSIPNWKRSHGTPQLLYSGSDPYVELRTGGIPTMSWEVGEGMFANYNFIAGQTYIIEIGLKSWSFTGASGTSSMKVKVANGISPTFSGASIPTQSGCFHELISVNKTNEHLVANITSPTSVLSLTLPAQPISYSQIWIYPEINTFTTTDGHKIIIGETIINVDYVRIKVPCKGDITFSNGAIPVNYYNGYNHIFAGSSYGGPAMVTSTGTTEFWASQHIFWKPNFYASPGERAYVLAAISPCARNPAAPKPSDEGLGWLDEISTGDNDNLGVLKLYPNPVSSRLYIHGRRNGSYTVLDLAGRTVLTGIVPQEGIDVERLLPGTYLLRLEVQGGEVTYGKFVKQ